MGLNKIIHLSSEGHSLLVQNNKDKDIEDVSQIIVNSFKAG